MNDYQIDRVRDHGEWCKAKAHSPEAKAKIDAITARAELKAQGRIPL